MLHRSTLIFGILAYSGLILASGVGPALALDPTGDWRVAEGVADIRIAQCGDSLWGVISWEQRPGGRDVHNQDVSKQSRPTLGMPILLDMKQDQDADQWDGEVYNAKDGKTYSSTIRPVDSDHLEIRGCLLGFLCGGETWTRVAGPIPSSPANSMAKGVKPAGAAPSKSGGVISPAPKTPGQKMATAVKPVDPVGDICLLPDIARLAH
jgi:uncharacterized protein (DUF2147 family)